MSQEEFALLLDFFKALGNETRLRIVGLLANRDHSVRELAQALGLKEPTVSQHLAMLKHAGLVEMRQQGNHHFYSFNGNSLAALSKELFSKERIAALVPAADSEGEFERKVFQTFFDGDRIRQMPVGEKRQLVILKWLANQFEVGVRYPEKQVNQIIARHHPDFATLRRDMVDFKLIKRERGIYWREAETLGGDDPAQANS
jgi:biotin operon repressor